MIRACQRIASSGVFTTTILSLIVLAGVLVGLETSSAIVARWGGLLHGLDRFILAVFVIELAIRLVASGPRWWRFFLDGWNLFDAAIVLVCLLPLHAEFAAVLRLARVLRVLRLVTRLPKLQVLVVALLKSIPSMGYVGLLLLLHFYIYAIIGVFLFGRADPEHFGSLPKAFLALFQIVTLEGWADLLKTQIDARATDAGSGSTFGTVLYFVSFILLGTMIILNLLIGVIMNAMQEAHEEHENQQPPDAARLLKQISSQLEELRRQVARLESDKRP
jgi:voltage-gated sodium channel